MKFFIKFNFEARLHYCIFFCKVTSKSKKKPLFKNSTLKRESSVTLFPVKFIIIESFVFVNCGIMFPIYEFKL